MIQTTHAPVDQHLLFATWPPFSPETEMSKLLHCSKDILPTLCCYNKQTLKVQKGRHIWTPALFLHLSLSLMVQSFLLYTEDRFPPGALPR